MRIHNTHESYDSYSRRTTSSGLIWLGIIIFCLGMFIASFPAENPTFPTFSIIPIVLGVILFIVGIRKKF